MDRSGDLCRNRRPLSLGVVEAACLGSGCPGRRSRPGDLQEVCQPMSHALKIFIFAALVTAFYNYVGQMVHQTEIYPPEEIKIEGDLTTEQLVALGKEITAGKGTCLGCHTVGSSAKGRFPDWAGIGANASKRKKGYSD